MKHVWALAWLAGLAAAWGLAVYAPTARAYPEPATVPTSWELDFTFDQPRAIAVTHADGRTRWYWYVRYKAQNNTGQARLFLPEVTIATDRGDIVTAGRGIHPAVFRAVAARHPEWLIERPEAVVGEILEGPDYVKESLAIWRAFEHDVDHLSVFVAGLSGETAELTHPSTGASVKLRKTLMIDMATPGTYVSPEDQPVELLDQTWVMR